MFDDVKVYLLLLRARFYAKLRTFRRSPKRNEGGPILSATEDRGPQNGIAIVTIVKDEAAYLAEWLEFHLMLGVRHVFIYDNGSRDHTPQVLAPYVREGLVTVTPWRNFIATQHPQTAAYAHSIANFAADYRWVAFIDVDEFMFPVEGSSLDATFAELADQVIVSLAWINFGPSGHETRPPGLVIANYTERAAFPPRTDQYSLLRYKSVVDPRKVWRVSTHACSLGDGTVLINDRGVAFPAHQARDIRYATADKLRLHHYFTRSREEAEQKIAKGRVSLAGKVNPNALDRRLRQYELATERDSTILRFVPELEARLKKRQSIRLEKAI
jgi:hypothetical protein